MSRNPAPAGRGGWCMAPGAAGSAMKATEAPRSMNNSSSTIAAGVNTTGSPAASATSIVATRAALAPR